ncbi:uncharacterized protein PEZ65_001117 [Lycodopsis pacificus]
MLTDLGETAQKRRDTTAELGSNLQSLKSTVASLREEQERERNMLEEALKLLSTLVSEHSAKASPKRVTDNASQTSPELEQPFSTILQDDKLEGMQLRRKSYNTEHTQAEVPPQHPSDIIKKKFTPRGHKKRKKRPLVLSQRSKCSVTKENRDPLMNCDKQQNASASLCERRDPNMLTSQQSLNPDCPKRPNSGMRSTAEGCFITPLSCWSQDSNSSVYLVGIESILETMSSESERGTPVKPQSLWQLFDKDCYTGF